MRILFVGLTVFSALHLQAQQAGPPKLHRVVYAADTLLRKPVAPKTVQTSIFERALRSTNACNVSCSPLPVTFLDIEAVRKSEASVVVQWETVNEVNTTGYDVERSLGDAHHFDRAGFVPSIGESNPFPTYVFPDANDFAGTSYYRIKQLDKDGKYSYSKTVAVKGYSRVESLEAFPNPAQTNLQLTLTANKGGPVSFYVFDATGRMVLQQSRTLSTGSNLFTLPVKSLAPGAYFVRTITPSEKPLLLQFIRQ